MSPAQIHNAFGMMVDLYGGMLKAQADEIERLKVQNNMLMTAMQKAAAQNTPSPAMDNHEAELRRAAMEPSPI